MLITQNRDYTEDLNIEVEGDVVSFYHSSLTWDGHEWQPNIIGLVEGPCDLTHVAKTIESKHTIVSGSLTFEWDGSFTTIYSDSGRIEFYCPDIRHFIGDIECLY